MRPVAFPTEKDLAEPVAMRGSSIKAQDTTELDGQQTVCAHRPFLII
jgi:hypothetical protein